MKAAAVFAAMLAFVIPGARRHHRFSRFGPANAITTVRAALAALAAACIGEPRTSSVAASAIGLAAAATLLDGLDGSVARRTGLASPFGARFDLEVDAFLILVLAVLSWRHGKAGAWILAAGLLRYAFVASGWMWSWMRAPLAPTMRGKLLCIVQIVALLVTLAPFVAWPLSAAVAAASLVALVYSFGVDTLRLWRQAA